MADNTFWIAALTGGTAVLASWVTSRGNTRAARIQADTAALAQRVERLRDSRRTAYLDLIEQTHSMGELYWEVAAVQRTGEAERRPALLDELAERERDEYGRMRRCVRVVELEGPEAAAAAANALQKATGPFHRALGAMRSGEPDAPQRFHDAFRPFWQALTEFVDAAKTALRQPPSGRS
ncbi:hypothetical protein [Streptomyces malaysiensis]|uniref:Uncharacterized protein n=1 Tax=Streptomyces malaysiensis subsp. samsunensis TaxID=459658 RepID=A0A9X2M0B4_STRMQ|nr:hypothetical protein [Streptomyces samsunensis]MCQ8833341.1 hypothetical protein [Streptomyces samsunensis]